MKLLLPAVDPDCLITERDPEKLNAYARSLLHQASHPTRSYPLEMVKAATLWLMGAYVDAQVPMPLEIFHLWKAIVRPDPRASTFRQVQEQNEPSYWEALRFEATHSPDREAKEPFTASAYAVARHVRGTVGFPQHGKRKRRNPDEPAAPDAAQKSAEATIRGWRRNPHYRQNVSFWRDPIRHLRQLDEQPPRS